MKKSKILPYKWWPEKKKLPIAFHKRKSDNLLLTTIIKQMLSYDKSNKMTVINHKVSVSGLGGIGKTTTAIWFATEYRMDYSHIIWIDCGEKRLINSFRNLARDLDVKHMQDLEIKQLALGSFRILRYLKCLFIFDNAECYTGTEGVKEVLPKFNQYFDVIITSRNKKWGVATGDGEVPQLHMNLFDQKEGVEFMETHINNLSKNDKSELPLLCKLVGNLPLALQIAVATLNQEKMHIQKYIDRIRNTPEIIHKDFDNYEKTINRTLLISLDFIKAQASNDERRIGEVAYQILTIFGYITPDDVPFEFFTAVETNLNPFEMEVAVKLLENYSLLSRKETNGRPHSEIISSAIFSTGINDSPPHQIRKVSKYQTTLSIHPLLQQVIRYSTKESQENILEKILTCKGFLDHKLIPFSYANEELQKKFPEIKAELIDKLKLDELLRDGRVKEAVELSRIISNTLKNIPSKLNFAVCLKHNSEFRNSKYVFNSVLGMISNPSNHIIRINEIGFTKWGTIPTTSNNFRDLPYSTKSVVRGQLLTIYLHLNDVENAKNLVLDLGQLILPITPLHDIISFLHSISITNVFLELHQDFRCITLNLPAEKTNDRKFELLSWVVDERTSIPHELHYLKLTSCEVTVRKKDLILAKNVKLCNVVAIHHPDSQVGMTPTLINEFVNICKIETLTLENMMIRSCTPIERDQLTLRSIRVDEWNKTKWVVNRLFLQNIQFIEKTEMTITKLEITHSSVDITSLPKSLTKLKLNGCFLVNCLKHVDRNPMPALLQELSLIHVYVEGKHGESCTRFDISHFISPRLSKLKVRDFGCQCPCLQLSLKYLTSIKFLNLENCYLELTPSISLVPVELKFNNVGIVNSQSIFTNAMINHFVDMSELQVLCLTGLTIDFSFTVDIRKVILINTTLVNWDTGCWSLQKLYTHPNPGHTQMKIEVWQNLQGMFE